MSSPAMAAAPSAAISTTLNSTADQASKPKPCCVCKSEKAARDECMLFTKSSNPEKDCASMINNYKSCMAGFGFNLP